MHNTADLANEASVSARLWGNEEPSEHQVVLVHGLQQP